MPKINWSDANMKTIPDGTVVHAIVDKVELKNSAASGQPMFNVKFKVLSDEYENRVLFRTFSLQGDALWALKQFAVRFGAPDDLFDNDDMDTDDMISALTNLEGDIEVEEHEWPKGSGEMKNGVKQFLAEAFDVHALA